MANDLSACPGPRRPGPLGEDRAAEFLEAKGYRIVARNFRCRRGEVDIIALDGDVLVFVEVKAWRRYGFDSLEHAVNIKKQRKIMHTAEFFLSHSQIYDYKSIRFDVIFIGTAEMTHLVSAFVADG
ncbi:MAG: YraN family protein [Treponema sp.]|jgi:putative endonuclease|nr:YraN family protein [Treponema sp.]